MASDPNGVPGDGRRARVPEGDGMLGSSPRCPCRSTHRPFFIGRALAATAFLLVLESASPVCGRGSEDQGATIRTRAATWRDDSGGQEVSGGSTPEAMRAPIGGVHPLTRSVLHVGRGSRDVSPYAAAHVSAAPSRFRGCHRMTRKPCLMADRRNESKRMRDLVSAPHGAVRAGHGYDRRMAQRSSWMRIMLPAGSRKAQSRTPYGCSVGSWTTSASLACSRSKVPSRSTVARMMMA